MLALRITFFFFILSFLPLAAQLPDGFVQEQLLDGLNPVGMTMDPLGRIWVIEKDGRVLIVNRQGELLPDPFLELNVDDFNERGLQGIVLHPDFDNNPYVYLYYTAPGLNRNRISRFRANGDQALPGSEEVLLELDQLSAFIHNGGALQFGADGMLYISTGDAGDGQNAQDLTNLLGKILRIRPDGSIPEDNPFYDELEGKNKAIYAYGLRNPFTMVTNRRRDTIFVGDVGSEFFEEVNHILPGRNYGWPLVEGKIQGQTPPENYMDPLFAYSHFEGCAIVGIAFNDPASTLFPPEYSGKFFFSDYCRGYMKYLDPKTGMVEGQFADSLDRPLAILVDPGDGTMFYLGRAGLGGGSVGDNTKTKEGTLWRVTYTGSGEPFISVNPRPKLVPAGESATFNVQALGKPDLQYQWQENEVDIPGANGKELFLDTVRLDMDQNLYRCIVSNAEGADTSQAARLSVTANQRPTPTIQLPVQGSLFKAGDTIFFAGTGTDPEQGNLPASAHTWEVIWHHNQHTHPGFGPLSGLQNGFFIVPTVNETDTSVWYRIYLSVEDEEGLSRTTFVEIFPDLTSIEVRGPEGMPINVDGKWRTMPHTFSSMKGLLRNLQALKSYPSADSAYFFRGWSDGYEERLLSFFTPADKTTFEVVYESVPIGDGNGLLGQYWNNKELTDTLPPALERVDSVVNFNWFVESPGPGVREELFSVRWTGWVEPLLSDTYTFHVINDDGVRLWVNDSLIIDDWINHATKENTGSIYLEQGRQYSIKLEYFEFYGFAEVRLWWSTSDISKRVIPQSQLYTPDRVRKAVVEGKLWLDVNDNGFQELEEMPLEGMKMYMRQYPDASVIDSAITDDKGRFRLEAIARRLYTISLDTEVLPKGLVPGAGLDGVFQTPAFDLPAAGEFISLALIPEAAGAADNFLIAPNPVEETLALHFFSPSAEEVSFEVYTISGQLMLFVQESLIRGENKVEIPFGERYASGVYYALIRIGEDVYRQAFFIKK